MLWAIAVMLVLVTVVVCVALLRKERRMARLIDVAAEEALRELTQARYSETQSDGKSADELLRELVEVGFLGAMPDDESRDRVRKEWTDESNARSFALGVLVQSGLALSVDLEVDEYPVKYDEFVQKLGTITRGAFCPTDIHQTFHGNPDEDDWNAEAIHAPYSLEFCVDGRVCKSTFEGSGSWYNLDPVIRMANQALKSSGRAERFAGPDQGHYQDRYYIFGKQKVIQDVARILGWKLDKSLDR